MLVEDYGWDTSLFVGCKLCLMLLCSLLVLVGSVCLGGGGSSLEDGLLSGFGHYEGVWLICLMRDAFVMICDCEVKGMLQNLGLKLAKGSDTKGQERTINAFPSFAFGEGVNK